MAFALRVEVPDSPVDAERPSFDLIGYDSRRQNHVLGEKIMRISSKIFVTVCILALCYQLAAEAQVASSTKTIYQTESDILYRDGSNLTDYMQERCCLDLYYPANTSGFATVVWFHGGGLKRGNKSFPKQLMNQGIAVAAVNYRLSPKAKSPAYIEDAAAAVAWTIKHIAKRGGASEKIFVSGHSAGGYLTSMIGMDKKWLAAHDIDANDLAGLIPYSGHTITHFTVREERGISGKQPVVDEMAPLFHVRKDLPPLLLITGDRDKELLGRYEETAYFWRMMQEVGHTQTELYELEGYNHGAMAVPAHPLMLKFIRTTLAKRNSGDTIER